MKGLIHRTTFLENWEISFCWNTNSNEIFWFAQSKKYPKRGRNECNLKFGKKRSRAGLISIYLFYLFIHLFMFSSPEPFGSSVTGAQRGLGVRGLQLDCGLGRPVRCSSTLGCDCSCSSWAPWASSLHLWCGCKLDIKLFIYLFICNIYTGWLSLAFKSRFTLPL